jgi:hypothetical protein
MVIRRWLAGSAAALAMVPVASCSGAFVAPTTLRECWGSGADLRGGHSADTDTMWTMTYSEEERPLGSTGTIYLCVPDDRRARVTTKVPEGIEVDRVSIVVGDGTDLPFPELHVTVTGRVDQSIQLPYTESSGGGSGHVDIEVDDGEWSFEGR